MNFHWIDWFVVAVTESPEQSPLGWLVHLSPGDRRLIFTIIGFFALLLSGYGAVCLYNVINEVPTESWLSFWHVCFYVMFVLGTIFLVWITLGGIRDLVRLFRSLKTESVDIHDDGTV
jgi:MFS family permease